MNSVNFKPLPLAIVGLSFGRYIIKLLQQPEIAKFFKLVAVSDLRKEMADEIAAKYGVKAYYSLDQVLQDGSIAVVGLYTQPSGRAKLLRDILRAGKDVMTTKPFELDIKAAEEVLREAQHLNRVLHLNSPSPKPTMDILQIQSWVKEYDLGRLVSARGEVWASYFEEADGTWMDDPMLCPGGAMMRLGIYLINDIIRLAGPIDQVQLVSSHVRTGRPTPDNALLTMSFALGCLGSVYASFCVDDGDCYGNGLALNYERGSIYRNVGPGGLSPREGKSNLSLVMKEGKGSRVVGAKVLHEASGQYQWENLYWSIINRETISDDYVRKIVEGVRILKCMQEPGVAHNVKADAVNPEFQEIDSKVA
jgi:predicted dehydrogenase